MTMIAGKRADPLTSDEWMVRVMADTMRGEPVPDYVEGRDLRCLIIDLQRTRQDLREAARKQA
jgi:hypothetical protein